jgi:hypothetical protein
MEVREEWIQQNEQAPEGVYPIHNNTHMEPPKKRLRVEDHFVCVVCHEIPLDAQSPACGHIVCGVCLQKCLEMDGKCPLCRQVMERDKIQPLQANVVVWSLYSEMEAKCKHCEWSGTYGALKKHMEVDCPARSVSCIQCGNKMIASELEEHARRSCPVRLVGCQKCTGYHAADAKHTCPQRAREEKEDTAHWSLCVVRLTTLVLNSNGSLTRLEAGERMSCDRRWTVDHARKEWAVTPKTLVYHADGRLWQNTLAALGPDDLVRLVVADTLDLSISVHVHICRAKAWFELDVPAMWPAIHVSALVRFLLPTLFPSLSNLRTAQGAWLSKCASNTTVADLNLGTPACLFF